jgi:hypothetical protein
MASVMGSRLPPADRPAVSEKREAELLLGALGRVKARRFGRLIVIVSDGRVVDVEVIEKIDREVLRNLSM